MDIRPIKNKFIAYEQFPHMWCPGCGQGIVLKAIAFALSEMGLEVEDVILCSGIGCSGRMGDYLRCHSFQGSHGRTLAYATGLKLAQINKTILAIMGDGDCGTIGGNHLIHCARRNLDITAIVINNFNFGMTGGQYSATTPEMSKTVTSPMGKFELAEDMCQLAYISGANFVARVSVTNFKQLIFLIKQAIMKKGFSFLEILSPCPTYFGKNNNMKEPIEIYKWIDNMDFPMGVIWADNREDFITSYWGKWYREREVDEGY